MLASLGGKGQICHRCHEHQAAARRRKGRGSSWRMASRLPKTLVVPRAERGAGAGRLRVPRPHCGGGSTLSSGRVGSCKSSWPWPATGMGADKAALFQLMGLETAARGTQTT